MSWAPTYQQNLQQVYPYYREEDEPLPSFASPGSFFSPSMSAMNTPAASFSPASGNSTISSFIGSDGHFYNFTDDNSDSQRSSFSEILSSQLSSFGEEQSTPPSNIFKHAPSRYSSFANIYSLAAPGPGQELIPCHHAVALYHPVPVHHQDPLPQLAIVPSNHTPIKMDPFSYPLVHARGPRTSNDLEPESPTSSNPFIASSRFSSQSTGYFSFDSRTSSPLSMDSSLVSTPASSPHPEHHQQRDYTPQHTPINTPSETPLHTPSSSPHLGPQTSTAGPKTSEHTSHRNLTRKKSDLSTTSSKSAPNPSSTAIRKPRRRPIASKLRPLLPLIPYPAATTPPPTSATYAQTIYQALMSTPTHRMDIRALYDYFRSQSPRGTFTGRGWQSSVRHNLSMNEDFIKTERQAGEKFDGRGFVWTLSERALMEGTVRATTGFRRGKLVDEMEGNSKRRKLKGKSNWGVVPEGPPPDVLPPNPPMQASHVGGGGRFQEEWECMWISRA